MPGKLGEDPGLDPVGWVSAAIKVLRVERLAAHMRDEVGMQLVELSLAELAVCLPPDAVLGQCVDDGVLVLRTAAGVAAGFRAQRTALGEGGLAAFDGMLVEHRLQQVPMDGGKSAKAELVGALCAIAQSGFLQGDLPSPSTG